jgi:hypothetical protein
VDNDDATVIEAENPDPLKRLTTLLRSVIPADPWQLVFLAGTIFLFISPRTAWRPISVQPMIESGDQAAKFRAFLPLFLWLIIWGSLAAYYMCFWSRPRPVRRIVLLVLLPALAGLVLIFNQYFQLSYELHSVLYSGPGVGLVYQWLVANLRRFPTGVYICALGLVLIGAYAVRIHLGLSSLPVSLRAPATCASGDADSWQKYKWLVFVLLCPYSLIASGLGTFLMIFYLQVVHHRLP